MKHLPLHFKQSTINHKVVHMQSMPITNMVWVHVRLCKLQKRVHSTHRRKW